MYVGRRHGAVGIRLTSTKTIEPIGRVGKTTVARGVRHAQQITSPAARRDTSSEATTNERDKVASTTYIFQFVSPVGASISYPRTRIGMCGMLPRIILAIFWPCSTRLLSSISCIISTMLPPKRQKSPQLTLMPLFCTNTYIHPRIACLQVRHPIHNIGSTARATRTNKPCN